MNADVSFGMAAALLFVALLRAAAPIVWASLGGLVSDLAGVINVGLEGIMLIAAFFGVVGSAWAPLWFPDAAPWLWPLVGAALGLIAAVLTALLLGVLHLELGADLIIAGIGINLLAAGLTVFAMVLLTGDKGSTAGLASLALPSLQVPGLEGLPVLDMLINGEGGAGHHVLVVGAFVAAAALWLVVRHTRFGLHLRAVGENPQAAAAAGLPVKRIRYAALATSGVLAGVGGLYLSMGYLVLFQADMTAGRGFLALAAVFLGARRVIGTLAAALVFGASTVLAARLGLLDVPSQLVYMVPPLLTLLALVAIGRRRAATRQRALRRVATQIEGETRKAWNET